MCVFLQESYSLPLIIIFMIQVDALSELFVAWDDTLTLAEDNVTKLERERDERRRLGLEHS